jgi:predicted ester cyclase
MTFRRSLFGFAVLSAVFVGSGAFAQTASTSDQAAANSTLLDRYVAAFNTHDAAAFAQVIAENYIQHNGRAGQGLAGLQATVRQYFETFGDFHMQVEDRIFGGDKVVARVTLTAIHSHPVQLGPNAPLFPPTGKKLTWGDIEIWRVADGKFVEHWDQSDLVGLARQMRGE